MQSVRHATSVAAVLAIAVAEIFNMFNFCKCRYCVKMAKHIVKLFHHRLVTPFLFFHNKPYGPDFHNSNVLIIIIGSLYLIQYNTIVCI